MIRLDSEGRNVTDLGGLWSEDDCEIVTTQYDHPSITSGQHTNGKANIFIRVAETGEWLRSTERSLYATREAWSAFGIEWFQQKASGDMPAPMIPYIKQDSEW